MLVGVCIKWTPGRPEVDTSGSVLTDDRFGGVSLADQAALEVALSIGDQVKVVCIGPEAAVAALRDSLAVGATAVQFVACGAQPSSRDVAVSLAQHLGGCELIVCGDYSADRGSGSVPAFLAAQLGASQALGLVAVERMGTNLECVRRLDGGRREVVRVAPSSNSPAVISVEGSVAKLRRASLAGTLAARSANIPTANAGINADLHGEITRYRPPTRIVAPPKGNQAIDRIRALTDSTAAKSRGELVTLSPSEAAERIIQAMREWGYLTS